MQRVKSALKRRTGPPAAAADGPIPPEPLRFRVHGPAPDDEGASFLDVGQRCAQDLVGALAGAGYQLNEFKNILDFGVGCGRTLRWLAPLAPNSNFHGADIDHEAIAWCRAHLRPATCTVNGARPPLSYRNGQFDLVYAISVLTHLNESYQFHWLAELRRIARPGALVIVTLHGDPLFGHIPEPLRPQAETHGFVFVESGYWRDIFPEWYQNSFHSRAYVAKWYPRFFRVLAHRPQGLAGHQDIVLLQRE